YIAVALTFSSTIIIVKLLSDKHEVEETHGKIALGVLIVQDIVVVVVMIGLSAFGGADEAAGGIAAELALTGVRAAVFIAVIGLLMRYVLPGLLERLAVERELLVLFAIAWAIALAASGEILGFSQEVGAFVGGVSLASTGYREAIGGRLLSVRDFLLLFFFVNLGVGLDFADAGAQVVPAIVLSLFVLIGNPLIVMTIMGVMGYRARTGFLTGVTVAQISEFSLIFAALGLSVGHITDTHVGLITVVGVVTIAMSTYLILYSKPLWKRLGRFLGPFERSRLRERSLSDADAAPHAEIIILGLGRFGSRLAEHLRLRGRRILAVDDDPRVVRAAKAAGYTAIYGDAGDPELLEHLPVDHARWVVVTVPELDATLTTLQAIGEAGYRCGVMVTARSEADLEVLEQTDAHFVAFPWQDAAEDTADRLDLMQPQGGSRRNVREPAGD
ncbi:MAG: cation:proton antiporter, partial [Actinomycetota bacterium]